MAPIPYISQNRPPPKGRTSVLLLHRTSVKHLTLNRLTMGPGHITWKTIMKHIKMFSFMNKEVRYLIYKLLSRNKLIICPLWNYNMRFEEKKLNLNRVRTTDLQIQAQLRFDFFLLKWDILIYKGHEKLLNTEILFFFMPSYVHADFDCFSLLPWLKCNGFLKLRCPLSSVFKDKLPQQNQ